MPLLTTPRRKSYGAMVFVVELRIDFLATCNAPMLSHDTELKGLPHVASIPPNTICP